MNKWTGVGLAMGLVALGLSGCQKVAPAKVTAPKSVAARELTVVRGPVESSFRGKVLRVSSGGGKEAFQGLSSYRIRVPLPAGAIAKVTPGQVAKVTLPIVHHGEVSALIEQVEAAEVRLLLTDQVQELSGHDVLVLVPLDAKRLYRVPGSAIYSPTGLKQEVFVVRDETAIRVAVGIVGVAGGEDLWISGDFLPGEKIVIQGLGDLLDGDRVQVLSTEGKLQ